MPFSTLQAFQTSIGSSVRELATEQLALVQSFYAKQQDARAMLTPQTFNEHQALMQEFVTANQTFVSSSLQATQIYWRDLSAESQEAFKSMGLPGLDTVAANLDSAVKAATSAKTARTKR
jgi:hypothetical protein